MTPDLKLYLDAGQWLNIATRRRDFQKYGGQVPRILDITR
jgi:hypothetical protein